MVGKNGILTPLIKQLTEAALSAELDSHLAQDVTANRKNGSGKKTIKALTGSFELTTPRDRNGTFEPQLVKKHQATLSDEIESKIIRLFALGMSYQDISREIEDLYAFSVSTAIISAVTDKVIPELKQWQQRPLEKVYPFVWLDAIHYKIREDGRYQSKAVYTVLALNLEGRKEVPGLYLSESEGANFWLSVLSDLQNSGVEDNNGWLWRSTGDTQTHPRGLSHVLFRNGYIKTALTGGASAIITLMMSCLRAAVVNLPLSAWV